MTPRSAPLAFILLLAGCPPAPEPDYPDAPRMRRDGGPPPDAYVMDAGPRPDTGPRPDAFRPRDTGTDATRDVGSGELIFVDGRLTEREWSSATDNAPLGTGIGAVFGGARFDRFLHFRTETHLYFAYEGDFPDDTAVVVYLDRDYGSERGILLTGTPLFDRSMGLNFVLSNSLNSIDVEFRPDLAWGSARRPETSTMASTTIGWRGLSELSAHRTIRSGLSACTARVCETSMPLSALAIPSTATIRFVMRVGNIRSLDNWAIGLTIPDGDEPSIISLVATIPPV